MWLLDKHDEWWNYINQLLLHDTNYFPLFFSMRKILRESKGDYSKYINKDVVHVFGGLQALNDKCQKFAASNDLTAAYEEMMMLIPEETFNRQMYVEITDCP